MISSWDLSGALSSGPSEDQMKEVVFLICVHSTWILSMNVSCGCHSSSGEESQSKILSSRSPDVGFLRMLQFVEIKLLYRFFLGGAGGRGKEYSTLP